MRHASGAPITGRSRVEAWELDAREQIREGVERALNNLDDYKPYKLSAPYTLVLTLKTEQNIYRGSLYPGAKRTGDWELTFVSDDVMEIIKAYVGMRR